MTLLGLVNRGWRQGRQFASAVKCKDDVAAVRSVRATTHFIVGIKSLIASNALVTNSHLPALSNSISLPQFSTFQTMKEAA